MLARPGPESFETYLLSRRGPSLYAQIEHAISDSWAAFSGGRPITIQSFQAFRLFSLVTAAEGSFLGILGVWVELPDADFKWPDLHLADLQALRLRWMHEPVWDIYAIGLLCVVMQVLECVGFQLAASRHGVRAGKYYTLLTACFTHSGLHHFLYNMLWLYSLGPELQGVLGRLRFIELYILGGVVSMLVAISCHQNLTSGASGAVYALEAANAAINPDRLNYSLFAQPVTALQLLALRLGFDFLSALQGSTIDYACHGGGALFGLLYCRQLQARGWGLMDLLLRSRPVYLPRHGASTYLIG